MSARPAALSRGRVGCDVVSVDDIRRSLDRFGDRYLWRVFTPLEVRQCNASPERIAARFAGKESVMKILRPDRTRAVPYREIEIASLPSGAPVVRLHGVARAQARLENLSDFSVSLSHDHGVAFATAFALATIERDDQMAPAEVREIVSRYGGLRADISAIGDTDDLYDAGLTSHASINVMLALEEHFDCEFPDAMLSRSTFANLGSITAAVESLGAR